MENNETEKELEPNEPGSNRGFGCMILDEPTESEALERDAVRFHKEVAELTREVFGEDKSVVFASGVLAGMELAKSRAERWAADESEPLPEGEHQAVDESEADEVIEEAVAEAETTKEVDILETEIVKKYIDSSVREIEKIIEDCRPDFQERVLRIVQDGLPKRRAEYEAEMDRDNARDNFINYCLNNLSMSDEKKFYEKLLADVKAGKELVADAA